jgi:hypothetical protein
MEHYRRCNELRFHGRMSQLTRRRDPDARHEAWLIFYSDAHVGTIAVRTGNPTTTEPWEWCCGFYPGTNPGECTSGTADTFEQARSDFEAAWGAFSSKRTNEDFQAWRKDRASTAWKYAMWDAGCRLPKPQSAVRAASAGWTSTLRTRTSTFTPRIWSPRPHEVRR